MSETEDSPIESKPRDNAETLTEKLTKTPTQTRLYQRERTIVELTELICAVMERDGVTRLALGRRLHPQRQDMWVDWYLDGGNTDMYLASDIAHALGYSLHFRLGELKP